MKKDFKLLLLLLSVTFLSCEKKDELSSPASSITSAGIISGTLANYNATIMDSVKLENYSKNPQLDKSKISANGEFLISMSSPKLYKIGKGPNGVFVSDTTTLTSERMETFYSYKNNKMTGEITKCNYTIDTAQVAGMSQSVFMYADKELTVKGTNKTTYTQGTYTENETITYDIVLNKGWNEVVVKLEEFTTTTTGLNIKRTMTSTITPDLQWRFFAISSYNNVKRKTRGVEKTEIFKSIW